MSHNEHLRSIANWAVFADDSSPSSSSPGEADTTWNSRQVGIYYFMEDLVRSLGKFDKTSDADGAHYFPGKENPFKGENLMCKNCAFFEADGDLGTCELVEGIIEPTALCKLWLIPESVVNPPSS